MKYFLRQMENFLTTKIAEETESVYSECEKIIVDVMRNIPTVPCNNILANTICVDLETTGVDRDSSEILQIAIIDGNGNELLNSYVKPYFAKEWRDAERINGISPEKVKDAPYLHDLIGVIRGIFDKATWIVGYNHKWFDLPFLNRYGINTNGKILADVMLDFAPIYGEWNEEKNSYKWKKLIECAEYFGYDWGDDSAHDGLADARATLHCFYKIEELKAKGEFWNGREMLKFQ